MWDRRGCCNCKELLDIVALVLNDLASTLHLSDLLCVLSFLLGGHLYEKLIHRCGRSFTHLLHVLLLVGQLKRQVVDLLSHFFDGLVCLFTLILMEELPPCNFRPGVLCIVHQAAGRADRAVLSLGTVDHTGLDALANEVVLRALLRTRSRGPDPGSRCPAKCYL